MQYNRSRSVVFLNFDLMDTGLKLLATRVTMMKMGPVSSRGWRCHGHPGPRMIEPKEKLSRPHRTLGQPALTVLEAVDKAYK